MSCISNKHDPLLLKNLHLRILHRILLLAWCVLTNIQAHATHSMGMDLTYQCLGGDTFAITLTFYRDCAGINAPGQGSEPLPDIDIISDSCNITLTRTLAFVSMQELGAVCPTLITTCSGGPYPGVEQYLYTDTIVLPDTCDDWTFSYALCCRNNAINTINPTNVNIYVETTLDYLNTPCNNSPIFTNTPVPFMCLGATFCFNNGAVDPDGDSLVYTLVTPTTGPNPGDTVNYLAGFGPTVPITSSPPLAFNNLTGDICITPTVLGEVSVMQVRVEEWRNGVQIGYIDRDIQLRVVDCVVPNTLPSVDGINGTGIFTASVCAGDTFCFFTNSIDPDTSQTITMNWNAGIPNTTFNITGSPLPVGNFCWLPDTSDISATAHCFTVDVTDDNCPFLGTQTFSFCITVTGYISTSVSGIQDASCPGVCDGQAGVVVNGGTSPYTYLWDDPAAQTNATAVGLCAGSYTVLITDSSGCTPTRTITVLEPPPLLLQLDSTSASCNGFSDATATVTASGGTGAFTYLWDNSAGNQTTATANGLSAGTYSVTVTDANGCDSSGTITILDPGVLSSVISDSTQISCFGGNDGTATVTAAGGVLPYTYLWDDANTQTDSIAIALIAGTYTVLVTDNNACTTSSSVTLTEPTTLIASTGNAVNVSCLGGADGAATATGSGGVSPYTFLWDDPGAQTNSTAIMLSAATYTVTVTDANGCIDSAAITLTEPASLVLSITDSLNITCNSGFDGYATVTPGGGTAPYTYLWDDPAAQTDSSATGLFAGTYNVVVTDVNSCTESISVTLTEPIAALALTYTVMNVSCNGGNNGSAQVFVTGGTPPYSYQWNDPAFQTDSVASGLYAGSYNITVTDNTGNCQVDTGIVITEPSTPLSTTPSSTDVTCFGGNDGTASVTTIGGTNPYTYIWNDPGGQTTVTAVGLLAGTYSVTITDNTGTCIIDTGMTVVEPAELLLSTITLEVLCFGDSTGTATVTPSGGIAPYTYLWNDFNAQTDSMATGLIAGTYTIIVTDSNGCPATDTAVVIVEPFAPLSVITSGVNVNCKGDKSGSANAGVTGGVTPYTYSWDDEFFQTNQIATGLAAGIYNVTITDSNNCVITGPVAIIEPALALLVSVTATDVPCFGSSIGTATVSATGGSSPYTYLWDAPAGNQTTATAVGLSAGTYSVMVTDSFGCVITDTSATVNQPPELIWDSLTVFASDICMGDSALVGAVYPIGDTSFTYTWDNGLGTGLGPFFVNPTDTTTYTITIADACGNDTSKSGTVNVNPLPVITLDSLILAGCVPLTVEFENMTQGPDDSLYVWDFGDGVASTESMPEHTFTASGTFVVTLTVTSDKICTNTSSGQNFVVVHPLPNVTCSADPYETDSRYKNIDFFGGTNGLEFNWNFGDGATSMDQNPSHYYDTIGTYNVVLTGVDTNMCSDTCELDINIIPYHDVVVPNAFTPNPNGSNGGTYDIFGYENDVFFPAADYIVEFHMMIFNRWGELVFETFDINIGWDGYYKGKLCQQDTYAWRINVTFIDKVTIDRMGEITLIR